MDFETKNSYSVTVTADDGNEGTDSIDVTINVTDVNERPDVAGLFSPSYDENGTRAVETYTAADPEDDDVTWSLRGTDRFDFRISSSGELTFRSSPDYEDPDDSNNDNVYRITVRASDGRLVTSVNVTVTVDDVNERPEVALPIADQTMTAGDSTTISLQGRFSDTDGDTLAYTAATSDSETATASVRRSTLTLAAVSAGSATITVTAADRSLGHADRLTVSQDFTVTVEETNVPPTFDEGPRTTRSVAENTASSTDVGSPVAASDDDSDTLTYSLSGTDAGSFRIGRISGQIRTFDSLNFETKNSYSVTVTADDDNGGTDSIDVTINVNDVNEAPVASPIGDRTLAHNVVSLEIDLSTYFSDPDTNDTLSYSASSSNTGVATVGVNGTALTLTAVSAGSATITVTAADRQAGDSDRLTVSQDFMVTVQPGIPGKPVILTPTNMIGGRGIELNWLPVDGADDYEVEIFSTTGMSAHDPDVEGLIAEVTGLTPGAMYSFRVRACNPSCVSSTSPLYSLWSDPRVHSAPTPTADGHQADHTAAYRIVSITSSPGLPNGVPDAAAVIRAAIRPAVAAWNSEMATEIPDKDLKICEIGDTTCRNRNHDGGIVTIETQPANTEGDGNFLTEPCGAAVACIGPIGRPLGGINDHIVDMEMIIEEPAWECRGRDTFNRTCEAYYRVFWTNVVYDGPSPQVVDPTTGNSVGFYRNAVRVITHEFGHALGLTDFYADDPEDLGSLEDAVMHTGSEIHLEDLLQLKAIYILHDPAGHGY